MTTTEPEGPGGIFGESIAVGRHGPSGPPPDATAGGAIADDNPLAMVFALSADGRQVGWLGVDQDGWCRIVNQSDATQFMYIPGQQGSPGSGSGSGQGQLGVYFYDSSPDAKWVYLSVSDPRSLKYGGVERKWVGFYDWQQATQWQLDDAGDLYSLYSNAVVCAYAPLGRVVLGSFLVADNLDQAVPLTLSSGV